MNRKSANKEQAVCATELVFSWSGPVVFSINVRHFAVASGETVLLLGESGSGKSTLLSLICGIFPPDSGNVVVDGVDLTQLKPGQRDKFRAEHIGVIDNVVLPIRFAPARHARLKMPVRQVAVEMLQKLGLPRSAIEQGSASQLSVGQQQRVAVARALIGAPELIIADEPTSSLDDKSQTRFLDLLFENVRKAGSTLLLVSHDERMSPRFDRTVRLSDIAEISREHSL